MRYTFIDVLRILSIYAVVFLHTLVPAVTSYGFVPVWQWDIAIAFSSLTRFAVPLFIMLSGAVLLENKQETLSVFYIKRMKRLGIPLLVWVVIFGLYRHYVSGTPFSFSYLIQQMVFNQPYEHLYFLVILLELAFITPVLRIYLSKILHTKQLYVFLVFTTLLTFLWIPNRFIGTLFIPYLGYYVLGFVLLHARTKKYTKVSLFAIVGTMIATAVLTHHLTITGVTNNLYFFSFTNPVVFITTISIFIFVKNLGIKKKHMNGLQNIVPLILGMYIFHPILLERIYPLVNIHMLVYTLLSPIIALIVFYLTSLCIFWMKEKPGFKRIV